MILILNIIMSFMPLSSQRWYFCILFKIRAKKAKSLLRQRHRRLVSGNNTKLAAIATGLAMRTNYVICYIPKPLVEA
ncbi:MAG: hypothetical protein D4S01_08595 [Dehalococcoidia bacterium]|nr:MAG: hypothetical protein D4S01_08595 [Dehalococcoidia bacterium]